MLEYPRKFKLLLHKAGNLAIANGVAQYLLSVSPNEYFRVIGVEIGLGATGSTSGSTTVDVKKNGTSILTAALSIAQGSSTKNVDAGTGGLAMATYGGGEPAGVDCIPGDLLRVDVTAIPGTTSADLSVYLTCVDKQV